MYLLPARDRPDEAPATDDRQTTQGHQGRGSATKEGLQGGAAGDSMLQRHILRRL